MALSGFTDHGFPGTIEDSEAWHLLTRAQGVADGFMYVSHMRPTLISGVTRTVRISAGQSVSRGVWSDKASNQDFVLGNQTGSKRYDFFLKETVQGADEPTTGTRIVVVSSSSEVIPDLTRDPMGVWQTPVAMAEVTPATGGATVTKLVDLRLIREYGSAFTIYDDMALPLADYPGVIVYNAKTRITKVRVYSDTLARKWLEIPTADVPALPPRQGWGNTYGINYSEPSRRRTNDTRVADLSIPSKPYDRVATIVASADAEIDDSSLWRGLLVVTGTGIGNDFGGGAVLQSAYLACSDGGTNRKSCNLTATIMIPAGTSRSAQIWVEKVSGGALTLDDGPGRSIDVHWVEATSNEW